MATTSAACARSASTKRRAWPRCTSRTRSRPSAAGTWPRRDGGVAERVREVGDTLDAPSRSVRQDGAQRLDAGIAAYDHDVVADPHRLKVRSRLGQVRNDPAADLHDLVSRPRRRAAAEYIHAPADCRSARIVHRLRPHPGDAGRSRLDTRHVRYRRVGRIQPAQRQHRPPAQRQRRKLHRSRHPPCGDHPKPRGTLASPTVRPGRPYRGMCRHRAAVADPHPHPSVAATRHAIGHDRGTTRTIVDRPERDLNASRPSSSAPSAGNLA